MILMEDASCKYLRREFFAFEFAFYSSLDINQSSDKQSP